MMSNSADRQSVNKTELSQEGLFTFRFLPASLQFPMRNMRIHHPDAYYSPDKWYCQGKATVSTLAVGLCLAESGR
jgi:hypothetical protein